MSIILKDSDIKELSEIKVLMIGRLANENDIENPIQEGTDNIRFFINPLCDDPKKIEEDINWYVRGENEKALYIAFDKMIWNNLPMEYKYETYDRKRMLKDYLQDKLIFFKTKINVNEELNVNQLNKDKEYKNYKVFKNIQLEKIVPKKIDTEKLFKKVPILNINTRDFLKKMKNGEYIEFNEYPTCLKNPQYIICENNIYFFKNETWEGHEVNKKMWKYIGNINSVSFSKINSVLDKDIIKYSSYLNFFTETSLESLSTRSIEELIKDESKAIDSNELNYREDEVGENEIDFIQGLKIYCENRGLYYRYEDIVNLQISIKTNLITIISGMTGTGKSQIAWAYAKMIDASQENENLIFIPISPTYMEPDDILGYYNPNNGLYIPTETGLVDFLVKAEKNMSKQYLIIFDEMNLAQVEYWFAPFISLLEADEENRYLQLYSKNNRCINEEKYPYRIKIGNNIRIVGTINLDETIKEFSDRLLDRANIIQLEKKKFVGLKDIKIHNENQGLYEKYICRDIDKYNMWIKSYETTEVLENELQFFDEFHELISEYDPKKGISFRVINSIAAYIANIPKDGNGKLLIDRQYAIDIQVRQRIISKLKGTKRIIGKLLGEYDFENRKIINSPIIDFLEKHTEISEFNETIKLIKFKIKELDLYGYTY